VHAFCDGDALTLGGVCIPHHQSLLAHSDGDVLIHALMDALLGALALGDIGQHFPDSEAEFAGANSRHLLADVVTLMTSAGYQLGNADMTIIAQAPKMASHIPNMCSNLAEDLGCPVKNINIKATTTEKLGFTGRSEGIACHAIVLLVARGE
jgi:2-C-methyl-D-erythritol 2,4-cyclodiphosphate synthase